MMFNSIYKDPLVLITAFILIALGIYTTSLPYFDLEQLKPIFLLWTLFVGVKGLEESRFLEYIATKLNSGSYVAQKIVILSFLFSLILSIDVALVVLLPLTLLLKVDKKAELFLLVAFSAHLGAALTPFGTPQNIFIYSFYHISLKEFLIIIYPFSLYLFTLFFALSFFIKEPKEVDINLNISFNLKQAKIYFVALLIAILSCLNIISWYFAGITILVSLFYYKNSLIVDYALLITFILFIGISNELKIILMPLIKELDNPFTITITLSQFITNVGATLLLHNFTTNYKALLLGSNIGSFGTPLAALANLITYKIYIANNPKDKTFLAKLIFWGFCVLIIAIVLIKLF